LRLSGSTTHHLFKKAFVHSWAIPPNNSLHPRFLAVSLNP